MFVVITADVTCKLAGSVAVVFKLNPIFAFPGSIVLEFKLDAMEFESVVVKIVFMVVGGYRRTHSRVCAAKRL